MRRCGCGRGLRRALGRREDSACNPSAETKSRTQASVESYGTPIKESNETRLYPLTSLGRVTFLPTRRKPTAIPSIHPTGRLTHNVPSKFKFETQANTYRKFGYTGTFALDTPRNARVTPSTPSTTRRERKLLLLKNGSRASSPLPGPSTGPFSRLAPGRFRR